MINVFSIYQAAFAVHLIALAAYWVYAINPKRAVGSAALSIFTVGTLLQAAFGIQVWVQTGQAPLANSFQALGLWTLVVSGVFLAFEWRWKLGLPGAFIAPLTALTLLMGFRFSAIAAHVETPALASAWLVAHVAVSMIGYAAFTLAFAVALAFLLQEKQVKSHQLGNLFYELPSLVELERLIFVCVRTGVIALAAGIIGGLAWEKTANAPTVGLDPKVWISLIALIYYASIWRLRSTHTLLGKKAAYAVLLGFCGVFFGFYLANTIGGGHGF